MSSKMPQPEVQMIKLHKNSNGMGLSIVAAKGAGQVSFLICYKVVKVFMKNLCQITLQYINQKILYLLMNFSYMSLTCSSIFYVSKTGNFVFSIKIHFKYYNPGEKINFKLFLF